MAGSKTIYERIHTVTNHDTGEITTEQTDRITILPKEPPFVKIYLDDISKIQELPSSSTGLLYELLKIMNFETNEIFLNSAVKRRIAKKVGIKNIKSVDNALTQFHQRNVLLRVERGIYMANPNLFGKGTWQEVHKLRRLSIRLIYSEDGAKQIEADIDFQVDENKKLILEEEKEERERLQLQIKQYDEERNKPDDRDVPNQHMLSYMLGVDADEMEMEKINAEEMEMERQLGSLKKRKKSAKKTA